MDAFEISKIIEAQQHANKSYLEFWRVPSLSLGLYVLPAGGVDPQQPHTEDEVYYVISGRGMMRVQDEDRPVEPGSIIFVRAQVEHRFHSITEELKILVFFAPAEGSQGP
jgi:mannose-6-phosphate isomerase-like protein (cupin superfamily)